MSSPLSLSPRRAKWLILGAWEPELARFRELAADPSVVSLVSLVAEAVGIGIVDAAIGITRCVIRHEPTDVAFIGTCGSLRGFAVGEAVVAESVMLVDPSIDGGRAVAVSPLVCSLQATDLGDALVGAGARRVKVANTIGVTTNAELAMTLSRAYDVEHLEAFAIARAAMTTRVPCTIVLGVANEVGPTGSDEWKKNHADVSARMAERLIGALVKTSRGARSPEQA
jgi:nucleoside phosphorylase